MKHRSPIAVLVLSLITFGIYDLYWLAKTKKVLNRETKVHVPSLWVLFIPYIVIVVAFIGIVIFAAVHNQPTTSTSDTTGSTSLTTTTSGGGTTFTSSPDVSGSSTTTPSQSTTMTTKPASAIGTVAIFLTIILAFLAIIVVSFWWFYKYSEAVDEYTYGEVSTILAFILLWLLRFIGMAIIQDKFNNRGTKKPLPTADGGAQQPPADFNQPENVTHQDSSEPPVAPPSVPNAHPPGRSTENSDRYPTAYVPPTKHHHHSGHEQGSDSSEQQ